MNAKKPAAPAIDVTLDADKLRAAVQVAPGAKVVADDVLRAMQRAGVVFGVNPEAVKLALVRRGQKVLVARGLAATMGIPGTIECESLDARESSMFTPIEDARGTVDNHGGHLMQTVEAGQVLAHLVAPGPGTAGQRVTGEVIPAERGREAVAVLGPGARLSDDRMQVLATRSGLPSVEGNRIAVLARCELKNVDFASGDVHFVGSVTVSGDVLPGFTIVATEDIEVRGGVEHGTLRAGGKITVLGGITHASVLEAIGDVAVRFVDAGCTITSGGAIAVRENAIRSTLMARRVVVGHQLVAGRTTASELIAAAMLGSESEVQTHLELTRPHHPSFQQAAELAKLHAKEQAEIQSLRRQHQFAAHDAARLKRLVPQEVLHELSLRRIDHEAALALEPDLAPETGSIVATAKMFRGVGVALYLQLHEITETVGKRTLRLVDGNVVES